jgi:hypothetical protein
VDRRIGAGGRYIGRRLEVGGIWKKVCEGHESGGDLSVAADGLGLWTKKKQCAIPLCMDFYLFLSCVLYYVVGCGVPLSTLYAFVGVD